MPYHREGRPKWPRERSTRPCRAFTRRGVRKNATAELPRPRQSQPHCRRTTPSYRVLEATPDAVQGLCAMLGSQRTLTVRRTPHNATGDTAEEPRQALQRLGRHPRPSQPPFNVFCRMAMLGREGRRTPPTNARQWSWWRLAHPACVLGVFRVRSANPSSLRKTRQVAQGAFYATLPFTRRRVRKNATAE